MIHFLRSLLSPRYDVRIMRDLNMRELNRLLPAERFRAVDDLEQEHAIAAAAFLRAQGLRTSTPTVRLRGDTLTARVRVRIQDDLHALQLVDALRIAGIQHSVVRAHHGAEVAASGFVSTPARSKAHA